MFSPSFSGANSISDRTIPSPTNSCYNAACRMDLQPGMIVAQKYSLSARLGTGAMGDVWSGDRIPDGLPVAIKLLLPAAATNSEVVARFRREAQVLSRIDSHYVARVLDFLCDRRLGLVLIMDLIPGESLLSVLQRVQRLSVEATLDIAADIVQGLRDLVEAKIVHRDLKPGNIVLRPRDGMLPQAVLVDFGMSRILASSDEDEELTAITRGDRVLGTLEYMAPEQILGARDVTSLADLYALGAIMFRAIAGYHAFGSLTGGPLVSAKLNEVAPPVPTGRTDPVAIRTQALVARLLARPIRERCRSVDEVEREIEAIRATYQPKQASVATRSDVFEDEDIATVCLPGNRASSPVAQMVASQQTALRRMATHAANKDSPSLDEPPTNPGYSPASRRSLTSLSPSEVQLPAASTPPGRRPPPSRSDPSHRKSWVGNAAIAFVSVAGGAVLAAIVLYLSGKTPSIPPVSLATSLQPPATLQPVADVPSGTMHEHQDSLEPGSVEMLAVSSSVRSAVATESSAPCSSVALTASSSLASATAVPESAAKPPAAVPAVGRSSPSHSASQPPAPTPSPTPLPSASSPSTL